MICVGAVEVPVTTDLSDLLLTTPHSTDRGRGKKRTMYGVDGDLSSTISASKFNKMCQPDAVVNEFNRNGYCPSNGSAVPRLRLAALHPGSRGIAESGLSIRLLGRRRFLDHKIRLTRMKQRRQPITVTRVHSAHPAIELPGVPVSIGSVLVGMYDSATQNTIQSDSRDSRIALKVNNMLRVLL